jgi:ribonuclease P protein subunit POP4
MMNARNLARHELIGLPVKVVRSADRSAEGLSGTVSDESRNMLEIRRDGSGRRVRLAKQSCTFRFAIPGDGTADLDGKTIRFRPEDRIKRCK